MTSIPMALNSAATRSSKSIGSRSSRLGPGGLTYGALSLSRTPAGKRPTGAGGGR
jgi:hypothetical protein